MDVMHGWCAGFFDAEGCIRISRVVVPVKDSRGTRPVHQVCLLISQNRRAVLETFQQIMNCGGNLDNGRLYEQYKNKLYTLKYSSACAMKVLNQIKPHLKRKRREAELVDRFVSECEIGRRGKSRVSPEIYALRDFYYEVLKAQKRRNRHD